MQKIPRCMSTQHPDNVNAPFFAEDVVLGGEDEIQEAYYAFSHLGCDEQMWDCEGKEVDNYVVKKLLTKYPAFFKEQKLGQEVFLTLRVPNPTIERAEAKVLLETLESIPRSYDAAHLFNASRIAPIFEVILPMTADHKSLDRIYRYYCDFVVGKQNARLRQGDIKLAEWIGPFNPQEIHVIPLFEDWRGLLSAHTIVKKYLQDKKVKYQRVFLARSDPAMNYGMISAVLLNKIALAKLYRLSHQLAVPFYPIVGVGSAPFRGNLNPRTVARVAEEYPSVHTLTIQSAFKYDYPASEVMQAIDQLKARSTQAPHAVDDKKCLKVMTPYCHAYQGQVGQLAPIINQVARSIPSRRKRKLHIGLFGYSRQVSGLTLPRVITFTAALYSLGIPPEILGLNSLDKDDMAFLKDQYIHLMADLQDAVRFFNPDSPFLPTEIKKNLAKILGEFPLSQEHRDISCHIIRAIKKDHKEGLEDLVLQAANLRKFLG